MEELKSYFKYLFFREMENLDEGKLYIKGQLWNIKERNEQRT